MRILFVNPFYKPYLGGIERVIEKLAQEFLNLPEIERVGVLTTKWSFPRQFHPDWSDRGIMQGVEVFRVNSWPSAAVPCYQVPLVWFSPKEIRKVIADFRPDIVQLMSDKWFWGNYWTWYFGHRSAKFIFSPVYHDLTRWRQWLRIINFVLTRLVDRVQVVTNIEKGKVKRAYFTPLNKIAVIPWGIDHHEIKETRRFQLRERHPEEVIILAVGRLSKHKGQLWLVNLFHDLTTVCEKKMKLVLVGQDEGEKPILEQAIRSWGLEREVIMTGQVSDPELREWYQKSDIFALFPDYESFGLVFIEAMLNRLPVVTHRVGAISEVLKDNALIVDPYHKMQAQVVLTKLIEDPVFRAELGERGCQFAQKTYSWAQTAQHFLQCYQDA